MNNTTEDLSGLEEEFKKRISDHITKIVGFLGKKTTQKDVLTLPYALQQLTTAMLLMAIDTYGMNVSDATNYVKSVLMSLWKNLENNSEDKFILPPCPYKEDDHD